MQRGIRTAAPTRFVRTGCELCVRPAHSHAHTYKSTQASFHPDLHNLRPGGPASLVPAYAAGHLCRPAVVVTDHHVYHTNLPDPLAARTLTCLNPPTRQVPAAAGGGGHRPRRPRDGQRVAARADGQGEREAEAVSWQSSLMIVLYCYYCCDSVLHLRVALIPARPRESRTFTAA